MKNDRRQFLKCSAVAAAATAVGISTPKKIKAQAQKAENGWKWDKAVCRFCGTGCGIMVATKNDQIVSSFFSITKKIMRNSI